MEKEYRELFDGVRASGRLRMEVMNMKREETKRVRRIPRAALIAAALVLALAGTAVVWLLTKKNAGLRVWVERVGLYPAAYIVSHCIVSGFGTTSYSLPRDFFLIVFLSLLLYGGLLLAYGIWRLRQEMKEINQ